MQAHLDGGGKIYRSEAKLRNHLDTCLRQAIPLTRSDNMERIIVAELCAPSERSADPDSARLSARANPPTSKFGGCR